MLQWSHTVSVFKMKSLFSNQIMIDSLNCLFVLNVSFSAPDVPNHRLHPMDINPHIYAIMGHSCGTLLLQLDILHSADSLTHLHE